MEGYPFLPDKRAKTEIVRYIKSFPNDRVTQVFESKCSERIDPVPSGCG